MEMVSKYLAVAAGSALGGMARYFVANSWLGQFAAPFPSATFVINVSGSFILGLFATLAAEKLSSNLYFNLAFAVGFVGAYTTFSTFEYETARLMSAQETVKATLYVVLSVGVGLLAVQAGVALARTLTR